MKIHTHLLLTSLLLLPVSGITEDAPSLENRMKSFQMDGATVTFAGRLPAQERTPKSGEIPARTAIRLRLTPAPGSNIRAAVWLPDRENWNGRLLILGNGGAGGGLDEAWFIAGLRRGFAVGSTDMGTNPPPHPGIGNPEVWKDFGYRATHLTTVAAKQLIQLHYGKAPDFSYFRGNSTGGQQGLQSAQRYPEDFDGIIATLPAHSRTPLHAYFLWNYQILKRCNFTPEQEKKIIAAAVAFKAPSEIPLFAGTCIADPRCTEAEIEAIVQAAAQADPSLSAMQLDGLRKLFDGPRHAKSGKRIFDGLPVGSGFWPAAGNLYLFQWVFGKEVDYMALDFGKDFDRYTAELAPYLNADNPDLAAFRKRGGKLLVTSGTADSVVPFQSTLDYYERVVERVGSLEETQDFFRFFLIPGMAHGAGPGVNSLPDWLNLMMDWREKGRAPESLEGKRFENGKMVYSVPLYPYPAKTAWSKERGYHPVPGPRGGVKRIAPEFLPPAR